MKKTRPLVPLFEQFISESKTGKRLKKDGSRLASGTIDNYTYALKNLVRFSETNEFELRICDVRKMTQRELTSEKNYWKKFYRKFTQFMYKNGCYDNYVGNTLKQIRTFFLYLRHDKNIDVGVFYKLFYVRKESIEVLVLNPSQLKFLIHDQNFDTKLTMSEKRVKDIFVFGCSTGLRFSDIFRLTNRNIQKLNGSYYLTIKSKKTKTLSTIKLPTYAVEIIKKTHRTNAKKMLFTPISISSFNKKLKCIGEKANFTQPIDLVRERHGKSIKINPKNNTNGIRFCDKMSSHMMRRTAITTMLILGMPEHLVRNISGHSTNSNSFYRYVHFAQPYLDKEIEKVHNQLEVF